MAKTPSGGPTRATSGTQRSRAHSGGKGSMGTATTMHVRGVGPGLKQAKGRATDAKPGTGKQTKAC